MGTFLPIAYILNIKCGLAVRLLVKPPLRHKMQKNNVFFVVSGGRADDLSLLKTKLHNCGRAGISFKQFKKIRQNRQMYATFPKSQKTHEQILRLKHIDV